MNRNLQTQPTQASACKGSNTNRPARGHGTRRVLPGFLLFHRRREIRRHRRREIRRHRAPEDRPGLAVPPSLGVRRLPGLPSRRLKAAGW